MKTRTILGVKILGRRARLTHLGWGMAISITVCIGIAFFSEIEGTGKWFVIAAIVFLTLTVFISEFFHDVQKLETTLIEANAQTQAVQALLSKAQKELNALRELETMPGYVKTLLARIPAEEAVYEDTNPQEDFIDHVDEY